MIRVTFGEKLQKAMKELGISQKKVSDLTGKSKASVSQYISDTQVPSEKVQSEIAIALGFAPDYFMTMDKEAFMQSNAVRNGVITKLKVEEAAKLLGMNHTTVKKGLQQGVFPWGYGIHTSENRWVYFINAKCFAEIEGIVV